MLLFVLELKLVLVVLSQILIFDTIEIFVSFHHTWHHKLLSSLTLLSLKSELLLLKFVNPGQLWRHQDIFQYLIPNLIGPLRTHLRICYEVG